MLDFLVVKRVATVSGAEDCSSARQDTADFLEREFEGFFRPDQAIEAIGDADDLPSIFEDGGLGGGADDGVEAGRVSAAGGNTNTANVRHRMNRQEARLRD